MIDLEALLADTARHPKGGWSARDEAFADAAGNIGYICLF